MPLKDREARRAYHREYMKRYLADPEAKRKHVARTRRNNSRAKKSGDQLVSEWKSGGCVAPGCGERSECCLVAHHVNPAEKRFEIGDARVRGKWPKVIAAELKKCICLCMNCHAKLHAGLIQIDAS